jgi:hypothetical protein
MLYAVPFQGAVQPTCFVFHLSQFSIFVAELDAQVLLRAGYLLQVEAKRVKGGLGSFGFILLLQMKLLVSVLLHGQQVLKLDHLFLQGSGHSNRRFLCFLGLPIQFPGKAS